MHFNRSYNYHFPEKFECNLKFWESDNSSDSSLQQIFASEIFFGFLLLHVSSTKKRLTWGVKSLMQIIKLQKIVRNL